jgi:predicted protein tyrosine phosphatase
MEDERAAKLRKVLVSGAGQHGSELRLQRRRRRPPFLAGTSARDGHPLCSCSHTCIKARSRSAPAHSETPESRLCALPCRCGAWAIPRNTWSACRPPRGAGVTRPFALFFLFLTPLFFSHRLHITVKRWCAAARGPRPHCPAAVPSQTRVTHSHRLPQRAHDITHILSVCSLQSACPESVSHCQISCEDVPASVSTMLERLPAAFAFISSCLEGGGRVLIHCFAGHSRSATVCAAYLIVVKGRSLASALAAVRQARPGCAPNSGFMRLLSQLASERDRVVAAEQPARLVLSPTTSGLVVR